MAQIQVDSEQVLAANSTIQATIAKVQSEVDALHSQLLRLQDVWRGSASASFQELVGRWKITATTVDNQLGELGTALRIAAHQYSEIEAANQRLFI
ncbi:MAG: WXG100 family type VII secretion target [Rhodoluna sp.]|jgi:early secretory antigenic target protein ESAT-6